MYKKYFRLQLDLYDVQIIVLEVTLSEECSSKGYKQSLKTSFNLLYQLYHTNHHLQYLPFVMFEKYKHGILKVSQGISVH